MSRLLTLTKQWLSVTVQMNGCPLHHTFRVSTVVSGWKRKSAHQKLFAAITLLISHAAHQPKQWYSYNIYSRIFINSSASLLAPTNWQLAESVVVIQFTTTQSTKMTRVIIHALVLVKTNPKFLSLIQFKHTIGEVIRFLAKPEGQSITANKA